MLLLWEHAQNVHKHQKSYTPVSETLLSGVSFLRVARFSFRCEPLENTLGQVQKNNSNNNKTNKKMFLVPTRFIFGGSPLFFY